MEYQPQKAILRLDKQISCEQICLYVQNLVAKYQKNQNDISNCFLVLEIKNISSVYDDAVPKLEAQ